MSINAQIAVWDRSRAGTSTMLLTLLCIADAADEYGRNAYPTLETLARRTRQSQRNVIRIIEAAEGMHELVVQRRPNHSNKYQVTPAGEPVTPRTRQGDKLSPSRNHSDKLSPHSDRLSPHSDIRVPQMSPEPLVTNGFHDDDDARENARRILYVLNAAGIEGRNLHRLAALWCQFPDGTSEVEAIAERTAREAVAGDDGRGQRIRSSSGLTVKRLREQYETRTGVADAWALADQRLATLGAHLTDRAIVTAMRANTGDTTR